jgi:hypothetical protein
VVWLGCLIIRGSVEDRGLWGERHQQQGDRLLVTFLVGGPRDAGNLRDPAIETVENHADKVRFAGQCLTPDSLCETWRILDGTELELGDYRFRIGQSTLPFG